MARMTLAEIMASRPQVDRARLGATTEEDIRRYMIEDGEDPDAVPSGYVEELPPAMVRAKLKMSQEAFAKALTIPVATLRNWEQGRFRPDPAARALLRIVARNPEAALAALREDEPA